VVSESRERLKAKDDRELLDLAEAATWVMKEAGVPLPSRYAIDLIDELAERLKARGSDPATDYINPDPPLTLADRPLCPECRVGDGLHLSTCSRFGKPPRVPAPLRCSGCGWTLAEHVIGDDGRIDCPPRA
jgi:hypothetical protein